MEQPGQAIPTEGFHEYSVDVMNTSFFLMKNEDKSKSSSKTSERMVISEHFVIKSRYAASTLNNQKIQVRTVYVRPGGTEPDPFRLSGQIVILPSTWYWRHN
jgi:hypothetical protein